MENAFTIINNNDNIRLNSLNILTLHLIKKYANCECQLKEYENYFCQNKYHLIKEIKQYKDILKTVFSQYSIDKEENTKEIKELKSINFRISKANELDNLKDDDYYDIIIDVK